MIDTPKMPDLLPCPFCDSDDVKSGGDDKIIGVWCRNCQAYGPNGYLTINGEFEWNTRADLAPQWKPIDDAPKDGTQILGIYDYGKDYSLVKWINGDWLGYCDGEPSIRAQGDFFTDYHEPFLTHFIDLPAPPVIAGDV